MFYSIEKYPFFVAVLLFLLLMGTTSSHEFSSEVPNTEKVDKLILIEEELQKRLIREDPNPASTTSGGEADSGGSSSGADSGGSVGANNQEENYGYDNELPTSPEPSAKTPGSPEKALPTPKDVGTGNDDGVVAKSIREAAEKETNPELREKLWDEYRKYKKGS